MKIGLVNEFFPPFAPGGAEWSMQDLARGLAQKGHETHVITPNYGASTNEQESGVYIHRFMFPKKINEERKMPGFIWHANPIFYLYSAYRIYKIAKDYKLEILHAQNKYSLVGTYLAAQWLKIPVLASIRDTSHICRISVCLHRLDAIPNDCSYLKLMRECSEEYYVNYYLKKSFWKHAKDKLIQTYHWMDVHIRRHFLNKVDAVVGVSRGILEVHEKSRVFKGNKPARKFLYNFVQDATLKDGSAAAFLLEKYQLKASKIVLYVGGFSRGKGSDDFIRAAKLLVQRNPNTQIVMIGSGVLNEEADNVHILNHVPHEEVLKFYSLATVVVVPSVCQESLSRVLLEALMTGRPVVGTRVGGTAEAVLDGENGFVVERKNPRALAEAIEKILTNEMLAKRFGNKSRELALTRFERSAIISQVEKLYATTIQELVR